MLRMEKMSVPRREGDGRWTKRKLEKQLSFCKDKSQH